MATTQGTGKLSAALAPGDTRLVLEAGNDPLTAGSTAQIEYEQVVVQNIISPTEATISRGANGTTPAEHAAGSTITLGVANGRVKAGETAEPLAAMGTHLTIESSTTPGSYIPVALVGPLSGPSLSRDTIDTTNQDNQSGYKEFIGSLKDGGEITLTLFWNPEAQGQFKPDGLYAAFEDGLRHNFQIILPSEAYAWTFAGVVTKMNFKYDPQAAQTADCTIKVSGKPSFDTFTPTP